MHIMCICTEIRRNVFGLRIYLGSLSYLECLLAAHSWAPHTHLTAASYPLNSLLLSTPGELHPFSLGSRRLSAGCHALRIDTSSSYFRLNPSFHTTLTY